MNVPITGSGDVTLGVGTLDINEDFSTTGNLDMTGGTILLASDKSAIFSGGP